MGWGRYYAPYVSVEKRKEKAAKKVASLLKKGRKINPVVIEGRVIAKTFWGKAWCTQFETWCEDLAFLNFYESRVSRGRSYVRSGSVVDLSFRSGEINALVHGSSLYTVTITIAPISAQKWDALVDACAGNLAAFIELLQGKFSKSVMELMTDQEKGLFPDVEDMELSCSCYDAAEVCKHIAAVFYGVGAHLDDNPEILFTLRHVNPRDLLAKRSASDISKETSDQDIKRLTGDLSALFGIEIEEDVALPSASKAAPKAPSKQRLSNPQKPSPKKAKG
jgi:uncharacterized Zn finger protein